MLRLPPLRHEAPGTLDEAVALLAVDGAMLSAGGTDLVPNLKRRQYPDAATIVSLRRIPGMAGVRVESDGSLHIGSLTKLSSLAEHESIPLVVREAALSVASPQIRNQGTIGGNLCVDTRCNWLNVPQTWREAAEPCLKAGGETCWVAPAKKDCWAVSSSDLAPVLVALGAEVQLVGSGGRRSMPLEDFYRNDGMAHLTKGADEIITGVVVPPSSDMRASYRKLRRRGSIDFPILGVAVVASFDDDQVCTASRIVLGSVASSPLRVPEAEEVLVGRPFGSEVIAEASEAARKFARPLNNTDLTSRYRKRMIPVYVTRALGDLVEG
ncbi:Xanthine dehydrogenase, FAD binding subunit [hydrothermal vent metagenome]|uniref:Xanthine dehydrogenase, FAD binding subunit n=1 Tax=hydrothermal vent metagenome TaxID=652676 RepID=A0A3B0SQB9_9ZZZZ